MAHKIAVAAIAALAAAAWVGFQLSPWPSVLLIRHAFAKGAAATAAANMPHVPPGVRSEAGLAYATDDADALLDVYRPKEAAEPLPAVVWIHGGGFVAGTRSEMSGYYQALAARGFVVASVGYTLAPSAHFPAPVRQVNAALAWIAANATRLGADPNRVFLAGDSAGAQIAAQTALAIAEPSYAQTLGIEPGLARESLGGVLLFCGIYDPATLDFGSDFGGFLRTVLWSYFGTRDPSDPRVAGLAVAPHVTPGFPSAFISAGNADPLAPQSEALARALAAQGVTVDAHFFPKEYEPGLGHEYQFELSTAEGRDALDRASAFLASRSGA